MENKGCFWRAKVSLFGRESVAAFLVGDLGCAYRDHDSADFRLDAAPPHPRHLSVSRRVLSDLSLPTCQPAAPSCCVSAVVTRHFPWDGHNCKTSCGISHSLLPGPANLMLVCSMPGRRGPADKGPTLIIVGKGEGAPDERIQ